MDNATRAVEIAAWAAAEGIATQEQLELLQSETMAWRRALERLLDETEDSLEAVRGLPGGERQQVVADFESELRLLETAYDRLLHADDPMAAVVVAADPVDSVRLQASWANGSIVVWAAAPAAPPADNDALADLLQAIGGPALGWSQHPSVHLPSGARAEALSIPVDEALGWLAAVGGGLGGEQIGSSVFWLGHVAVLGVRLVARGAIVPTLAARKTADSRTLDLNVRWGPALVGKEIDELAAAMPGPVVALNSSVNARTVTMDVVASVIDTIVGSAAKMVEFPAPPPSTRTVAQVAEAVVTRLDGSTFNAPVPAGAEVSKRLDRWAKPVTAPGRANLVVQLDPPDKGDAWFLQVMGPGAERNLLPIELALGDSKNTKPLADELARLERILPVLLRAGGMRRGQVYL